MSHEFLDQNLCTHPNNILFGCMGSSQLYVIRLDPPSGQKVKSHRASDFAHTFLEIFGNTGSRDKVKSHRTIDPFFAHTSSIYERR